MFTSIDYLLQYVIGRVTIADYYFLVTWAMTYGHS